MGPVQNSQAKAASTTTTPRYSKRKRATVNYCEQDVDANDVQVDEYFEETQSSNPKKRKTAALKPLPKRKIFPFLKLPAEIRNQIYGFCFTDPAGIYLCASTKKARRTVRRVPESHYRTQPPSSSHRDSNDDDGDDDDDQEQEKPSDKIAPLVPGLLAVNKQIYQEAREILYANDFYLGDTLTLHSFLVDVGARAALLLKSVALIQWGQGRGVNKAYNHAAFTALSAATNLERFAMFDMPSWHLNAKAVATQFYRDAFPWLEAVGTAWGKVDAAVNIVNISTGTFRYTHRSRHHWYPGFGRNDRKFGGYDEMAAFRVELANFLNGRMEMIRS